VLNLAGAAEHRDFSISHFWRPIGVTSPLLDQCYRGLDALSDAKESTEELLYGRLCNLTNLGPRLALYDLTSTYFENGRVARARPSLPGHYGLLP
jgi:hypothetical protein